MLLAWIRFFWCGIFLLSLTLSAHAVGGPGFALSFPNTTNAVSVLHTNALNVYPLTVTVWINVTPTFGFIYQDLVKKHEASNGWRVHIADGEVYGLYFANGANFISDGGNGIYGGFVADGVWHQVTYTVDASGGKMYLDGVLRGSLAWTGTPAAATTTQPMLLGGYPGPTTFQNVALDEVTVWNVALNQTQIQANKNRSLAGNEAGLLAYYRGDEGSGFSTVFDSAPAGGNNDGTRIGERTYIASGILPFTPMVETSPATGVGQVDATLNGVANPEGTNTVGWFQWGASTNYGNITLTQSIGSGTNTVNFNQFINGLTTDVTYHYRAAASNSLGVVYGVDQIFTPGVGGGNINLTIGGDTYPHVTQHDSGVWGHSNTIVVAYSDSRGVDSGSFGGASVSTNGGGTFTRLSYLFTEGGECLGNASVFYSARAAKWFISFMSTRCGTGGIGQWESTNGVNWVNSGCIASGSNFDRPSTWVDNNPASPFYGRQYAAYNNFSGANGALTFTFSTDDGISWSAPAILFSAVLRRVVKVTGSLGTDGTVFIQTIEEGGGGLNGARQNYIYRSINGGDSWTSIQQNATTFLGPGRSVAAAGYFAGMYATPVAGYWTEMGQGQPGVGPNGVVHYVYCARPALDTISEPGNIYYIRSTNNGVTWSAPLQLNTDTNFLTRAQWGPSLSVNTKGVVYVSWYDERNTTGDFLERYGRASFDNGQTWGIEAPLSDVVFPKPLQPDPKVQATRAGTYNFAAFSNDGYGDEAYHTWTDGRVSIGSPQQDVFFARKFFNTTLRIDSIVKTNGQIVLKGIGFPNAVHTIQVTTNLAAGGFLPSASVTSSASGRWQYNAGTPSPNTRFFRLAYP